MVLNGPTDKQGQFGFGDVWTWTALCADTKRIVSWKIGTRGASTAYAIIHDLAARLANCTQLTTDGVSKLLVGVPKGAWLALSRNEDKVLAYAAELQDAIQKAKDAGENDPIVMRVPEGDGTTLLLSGA